MYNKNKRAFASRNPYGPRTIIYRVATMMATTSHDDVLFDHVNPQLTPSHLLGTPEYVYATSCTREIRTSGIRISGGPKDGRNTKRSQSRLL